MGKLTALPIKPAPDIFLRAAATLGVPPDKCLVFEDTEKGLRAAAAGLRVAAMSWRPTSEKSWSLRRSISLGVWTSS